MQTIEDYKENIFKEGIKRMMFYAEPLRHMYDEIANYLYYQDFNSCSEEIKKLHNIHKGERCFIVATGPSLNNTNLNLIKHEHVLAVNTAFQTLSKHDISSDYYVVSDRIIWDVYSKQLLALDTNLFIGYVASRHYFRNGYKRLAGNKYVLKGRKNLGFSKDISKYICVNTPSVVYLALQVAYYLGFKNVYLLGCDCDYSGGHSGELGFVDTSKVQVGDAEKQFWNQVFDGFKECRNKFNADGRTIYNSTVDGFLDVFERVKLEDL